VTLTNKKIDDAIKSFTISCMNNVKWKRVCTKIAELQEHSSYSNRALHIIGKPVWSEDVRRVSYRLDQVSENGIRDPGLFGNDREEYKQIEWLKINKDLSEPIVVDLFIKWASENNIEVDVLSDHLMLYGYKK